MKVAAIIPSLNPDKEFLQVVEALIDVGFERIYVVNDGSGDDYTPYFDEAASRPQCVVLRHAVNRGKGRALKTAIERYLDDDGDFVGVVTVDADGQHHAEDVVNVAQTLESRPDALILGSRDFSLVDVPKRSEFGNKLTRAVFKAVSGVAVTDTQTGLRGIPNDFARALLTVEGERYEFETNMLLEASRLSVPILETPISTIYIENNSASHFRPLVDSFRIYRQIVKYAFSSLASFLVDYGLFMLLFYFVLSGLSDELRLVISIGASRVCSALFNYCVNRKLVFGSGAGTGVSLMRYVILCAAVMLSSYLGVRLLTTALGFPTLLSKLVVDIALFAVSFTFQRRWVFKA